MGSATSTRRDARRNHERLLAEAKKLFAERGIDAPLDELAARAGVGAGTVYRHFPSRTDLLREVYDDAIRMFHDLEPEVVGAPTGWDGIVRYLTRLGEWVAETPYLSALMRRVAQADPEHRPGLEFEATLESVLDRAKSEGSLRTDVTVVDLAMLVDLLGAFGQYGAEAMPFWRRQLAIVLDGLRARPDLEPLPGPGLAFGEFHEVVHRRGTEGAPAAE
ncbi:TetR/AcrR family transcriptional regulator [Agromyces sp. MMS24-JH15]|uniref:TetR/AcrR family transcriptional regulator n=1 Tax=Agromyces sp. MMS24-JH15 TaxID=3243765 RepID=UPI003748BF97